MIFTLSTIRTWIPVDITESNLGLTVAALIARLTTTFIVADFVDTCRVVFAQVSFAVVHIHLTSHTFKSSLAFTSKICKVKNPYVVFYKETYTFSVYKTWLSKLFLNIYHYLNFGSVTLRLYILF